MHFMDELTGVSIMTYVLALIVRIVNLRKIFFIFMKSIKEYDKN